MSFTEEARSISVHGGSLPPVDSSFLSTRDGW
jgi:hypothetical protein